MKYAIISDIHGNLPALLLVLADAAAQGAQQYLFVGDERRPFARDTWHAAFETWMNTQ